MRRTVGQGHCEIKILGDGTTIRRNKEGKDVDIPVVRSQRTGSHDQEYVLPPLVICPDTMRGVWALEPSPRMNCAGAEKKGGLEYTAYTLPSLDLRAETPQRLQVFILLYFFGGWGVGDGCYSSLLHLAL